MTIQLAGANPDYVEMSSDNRITVANKTLLFQDRFNYTAQNTATWRAANTTMALVFSGSALIFNNNSTVSSGSFAVVRTYKSFELFSGSDTIMEARLQFGQVPISGNALFFGIGVPGTTAAPTDGVYFQIDSTGALTGVLNYNGSLQNTPPIPMPSAGVAHTWAIKANDRRIEFWIDGALSGTCYMSARTALGLACSTSTNFAFFQSTNLATTATAQQVNIFSMDVHTSGSIHHKSWQHILTGLGQNATQGQSGGTMGSTANYANSANPTAAVPTNTTAALGSGLGGQFWETASLAVNTDGIIASFQNPAGGINQTPRDLYITGFRWGSIVQTVLAGGPFIYVCSIAYGSTNVSLATAEAATAKARRIYPIGVYTLPATAAVGTVGANFTASFTTPLLVQSGEFIQTIVKNIGTVGTSGTIAHQIAFEGYFE